MITISLFQVKNSVLKQVRLLLLLCFIMCPGSAFSQDKSDFEYAQYPKEILNAPSNPYYFPLDTLPVKERIYMRTNLLEWALLSPNVMVEYDILPYSWNKWTVAIGGRYNDFAKQIMSPKNVFNIKTFRLETRRYWHTTYRIQNNSRVHSARWYNKNESWGFIRRALSRQRERPRLYKRAYYAGAFVSMSDFSIKLGQQGKQGKTTMFGATFGFQQPLFGYTSGSTVDLELGINAGIAKVKYDTYQYNSKFDCYPKIGQTQNKIVPVVSEIRLALVYRFGRSSTGRYHERYGPDTIYTNRYDSIKAEKDKIKQAKEEAKNKLKDHKRKLNRLDSLARVSPVLSAYESYKEIQDAVDIDSTEFGRILHQVYAEHFMLKEAQKVSPERYQQVKDSLDALRAAKKNEGFDKSDKKDKKNFKSEKKRIMKELKEIVKKRKANIRAIKSHKPINNVTETPALSSPPSISTPAVDKSSKGKNKKSKKGKGNGESEAAGTVPNNDPVAVSADSPESEATTPEDKGGESE